MVERRDPLDDALSELRFRCVPLLTPEEPRPWRRDFPRDTVSLHVPLEGSCHIDVETPIWTHRLERGEILVVNRGLGGALRAAGKLESPPKIVSVRVEFEAPHGHPLLESLPDLIQASPTGGDAPRSFGPLLDGFLAEMSRPRIGQEVLIVRFCEALFIQGLRSHLMDISWDDRGWFRAVADPLLGTWPGSGASEIGALESLSGLAACVGRSPRRSSARFRKLAGFTPSDLLQRTRARRAARLLREGATDLARIAHVTGYRNRPSFCRAFKRELGVSPAAYWRSVHGRRFPRQPSGPEKTGWEAESAYGCPDMWELRFTLEEEADDAVARSGERGDPAEPE